jgi:Meckel syndrome type 1 protein
LWRQFVKISTIPRTAEPSQRPSVDSPEANNSQEEIMAVLNLDASEPYTTPVTSAENSPLFPSQPIYARKPAKKSSSNLPLIVGLPVLAVAAGALAWGMMSQPAQTPTTDEAQVAEAKPLPTTQPPAPMPTPAPVAATPAAPAPTQVARAETTAPPRVTAPAKRAAPARRAAPATAPDAESASSNVSATIPAPVTAPAPTPVIAAPAAPAPAPTPAPVTPVTPDAPM